MPEGLGNVAIRSSGRRRDSSFARVLDLSASLGQAAAAGAFGKAWQHRDLMPPAACMGYRKDDQENSMGGST
jgi:hypothetical protein